MTLAEELADAVLEECVAALDDRFALLAGAAVVAHKSKTTWARERFIAAAEAMRLEADTADAVFGPDALDEWLGSISDREYSLFISATSAVRPGGDPAEGAALLAGAVRAFAGGES